MKVSDLSLREKILQTKIIKINKRLFYARAGCRSICQGRCLRTSIQKLSSGKAVMRAEWAFMLPALYNALEQNVQFKNSVAIYKETDLVLPA